MIRRVAWLCLAFLAPFAARAQAPLVFATEGAKPPWNSYNASGALEGFDIDLIEDLCKRMKRACATIIEDWDSLVPALKHGRADAAISGITITKRWQARAALTRPYALEAYGFAAMRDNPLANMPGAGMRLDPMSGAGKKEVERITAAIGASRVGVVPGSRAAELLKMAFPSLKNIRNYATPSEHFLDLVAGRVDVTFSPIARLMADWRFADFKDVVKSGPVLMEVSVGPARVIALKRGNEALHAEIDAAIAAAAADGTLKTLSKKWFQLDMTPP